MEQEGVELLLVRVQKRYQVLWFLNTQLIENYSVIKIKGKEWYYRGELLDIKHYADIDNSDAIIFDLHHRPKSCRIKQDFETIFYMRNLVQVLRPMEIEGMGAPQRPVYFEY